MLMRQKLQKMYFFIFIFQMEERGIYFFPSQIRYGFFRVYTVEKKFEKRLNIKITIDEYVSDVTNFETDIR